jgi:hypothetical protein
VEGRFFGWWRGDYLDGKASDDANAQVQE